MRRAGVGALALSFLLYSLSGYGQGLANTEMRRKAAFVGKMLKFVDWPGGVNETRKTAFPFCVAGDPFLSFALSQELHGTKIQGHDVEVRSVQKEADLQGCEALYFAGPSKGSNGKWLQKLKGTSVLTIGEEKAFLDDGGMVRILCQSDVVQFEVNLDCIRSAGLKIDARLLELAKGVTTTGRPASGGR